MAVFSCLTRHRHQQPHCCCCQAPKAKAKGGPKKLPASVPLLARPPPASPSSSHASGLSDLELEDALASLVQKDWLACLDWTTLWYQSECCGLISLSPLHKVYQFVRCKKTVCRVPMLRGPDEKRLPFEGWSICSGGGRVRVRPWLADGWELVFGCAQVLLIVEVAIQTIFSSIRVQFFCP